MAHSSPEMVPTVPQVSSALRAAPGRGWSRPFRWLRRQLGSGRPTGPGVRQTEERFRSLFEHAEDLIVSCRLDGTITDVNRALEKTLGWTREELIGQPIDRIVTPASVALVLVEGVGVIVNMADL